MKSFGQTYDGKYAPIEDLPKLQSVLDFEASGSGEISDVLVSFRKPIHAAKACVDRDGAESSLLVDEPLLIPFPRLQGRRVKVDLVLHSGQTETVEMDFPRVRVS